MCGGFLSFIDRETKKILLFEYIGTFCNWMHLFTLGLSLQWILLLCKANIALNMIFLSFLNRLSCSANKSSKIKNIFLFSNAYSEREYYFLFSLSSSQHIFCNKPIIFINTFKIQINEWPSLILLLEIKKFYHVNDCNKILVARKNKIGSHCVFLYSSDMINFKFRRLNAKFGWTLFVWDSNFLSYRFERKE